MHKRHRMNLMSATKASRTARRSIPFVPSREIQRAAACGWGCSIRKCRESGLILKHSASGSVTGGYSHGYPVELKRQLLEEWAAYIERVTTPERVTRLR